MASERGSTDGEPWLPMRLTTYSAVSAVACAIGVTGSDVIARMAVGRALLTDAVRGAVNRLTYSVGSDVWLFSPFGGVGLICGVAGARFGTRGAVGFFAAGIAALNVLYLIAFLAAQRALLEKAWTAATLSIALLPVVVGVPVLLLLTCAVLVAGWLTRRPRS